MAIAEEVPRVLHAGNGTRGPFSLSVGGTPITYADSGDIIVTRFTSAGVGTVLTEGDEYTLSADSVLPDVGETVQTVTAATFTLEASEAVLAVGESILAERASPTSQGLILPPSGGFPSAAGERNFDAILRLIQELYERSNRTLILNRLDTTGSLELDKASARAGKLLAFDDNGALDFIDPPEDGEDGATGATGPVGPTGPAGPTGDGSGDVLGPATHADETFAVFDGADTKTLKALSASDARTLLGLGTAALLASSAVFQVSNNLSEGNAATMRSNLGLGSAALLASSAVAQTANNLSDLASAATARTNLGLGSAAVLAETTTAEYHANTADRALSTDQVWAAGAMVALTDASTIAVDLSTGINFEVTIEGNRTLGAPSNAKVGQCGVIYVTQDGVGSRTLAYHANYKWVGGSAGVLSTAIGAIDRLTYFVRSSTHIDLSLAKALA